MSGKAAVADDDFKRRAMEAYKAKGKGATVQAAAKMKVGAANTRRAMNRSESESSLSSESELSDDEVEDTGRGGRRSRKYQEDSLSDSESDGERKLQGFDDDTYGTEGAMLAKKMRQRSAFWKTMDKVCPCCAMSSVKYAVGENKADPAAKLYEGVDNTLEPVMRLLSLFTMGVPSTESVVPMAHLLPLILSSLLCLGGSLLYASDWTDNFPLNAVSFMVLFVVQFCFLAQGSRYFRTRAMSKLCQELEGRSWNWTRQLPELLKQVNKHSGMFLAILTVGYAMTLGGYFVISDIKAVDGQLIFYVSRVLFGFYMNGVLFCMPILFSLEAALVSARVQCFTEAIGKFPNLDSAIEEHIEIWKCIDRLSNLWSGTIVASLAGTTVCAMTNIHYLLSRQSYYFLQNMTVPAVAVFIFLFSAAKVTERCRYTAVHLSGYRSSADIFLAPLERIDFLTYLNANDPGFRVAGVVVSAQGVQKILGGYMMVVIYLFTLQALMDNVA